MTFDAESAPRREWARMWLDRPLRQLVGGRLEVASGKKTFKVVNPADRSSLTTMTLASAADVDRAVAAAGAAFTGPWRRLAPRARGKVLQDIAGVIRRHAAELATLETLANGKLYRESLVDDVPEAADVFDYYAGWVDKIYGETAPVDHGFLNYTLREPVGVCALIVPWNFPLLLACWKIAPALAMGNTVVVKPSEYTSLTMVRLAELITEELDLPPGVINVVLGDGEAGQALVAHPGVAKVSFTGSTGVGRRIVEGSAASNLKGVTLELGGKSPNIIFDDFDDLPAAIERSFTAMFSHKGEKCSEPTRLLVQRGVYDRVVAEIAARCDAVRCGDPFAEASEQGPQCHEAHFAKVMSYIETGKAEGARVAAGGRADTDGGNARGLYVRPTLFADVDNSMSVARDEIFGPVLVAIPFATEAEAVRIANDTSYGLAAGLWTSNVSRAHRVAAGLEAGMVFVNRYGCYDFASPFGGFKQSGWGKEMALHSLAAYTRTKSVWVKIGGS